MPGSSERRLRPAIIRVTSARDAPVARADETESYQT